MGMGGISIWQLLIILAIVLLIFGTKRLKNMGGDLGGAIRGFKKAMKDDNAETKDDVLDQTIDKQSIEQDQIDNSTATHQDTINAEAQKKTQKP